MEILNIDPKVLAIQAGGFLLLLVVFKLFLFKPIRDILDQRRRDVESRYEDADTRKQAAEDLKADYERHLSQIDDEMRAKITEAVKQGQEMRDEIIADSRVQAEQILTKAQAEIGREKEKAMVELKTTVADLAVEAAGRLVRERMDDKKHRELIGKFIDEVGEARE